MDFTWIVVGLVGWVLALVFVMLLMRMAAQQDRAARHNEKTLDPFSDVTITKVQKPTFAAAAGRDPAPQQMPRTPELAQPGCADGSAKDSPPRR